MPDKIYFEVIFHNANMEFYGFFETKGKKNQGKS